MKKATIVDVAQLAGVSIKTVSRVANDEAHVSDATRRKVSDAIESLGYQADEHARWLGSRRRAQAPVLADGETEAPTLHTLAASNDPMRIDWD